MSIREIFIDPGGRPRSGWRFAIFAVAFVVFGTLALLLSNRLLSEFPIDARYKNLAGFVIFSLSLLIPALIVGWLCGRFLEGLPFRALGAAFTKQWFKHLLFGLLVGALTLGLSVAVAAVFGGLSFVIDPADAGSIAKTFGLSFIVFAVAAAFEETLFRGYAMQTFLRSRRTVFGILFMSLVFATAHNGNPSADLLSWVNTFLAGIWFAIAYLKTRDLWFPFGMHLAWNWTLGAFFGIEVSGLTDVTSSSLLKEIDRGPAWLTGENYGIEAGVACTAALVISTAAIYILPIRKGSS